MNIETIITFIQQLGFPIAVTAYLLYDRSKLENMHKTEMSEMSKAIQNNTSVMERILEHIRKEGE